MPPVPPASASDPRTLVSHPELKSHQSFPSFRTIGEPPRGPIERFLSIFADVRAGEGVGALLLTLNVFLLLAGYYLLKPARDALILTEGALFGLSGSQLAAYAAAGQALLLLGVIPVYGWLASRVPRIRLIGTTSVFFASNLVLFFILGAAGVREGLAYYVWLGIYNNLIVAQFWGFANDLYTEGQGRRLFPLIGVGGSLGAWVGSASVQPLVRSQGFTPYTLMLAGAIVLLISFAITVIVNRRERLHATPEGKQIEAAPLGKAGGFQLILRDRYLTWIALLIILLNIVNSLGQYLLNTFVESWAIASFGADVARRRNEIGLFFGSFYQWVNLIGLLLQLFVTSRVFRFMGVRGALFILPVLALINYSVIAVAPILIIVRLGKILENSTDYSIQNTVRQALYLPTSREAKYKAKAAIDTFCTRLGDVLQAVIVFGGSSLGLSIAAFAWLNVALTAGWLGAAGQIAKEHRKKTH